MPLFAVVIVAYLTTSCAPAIPKRPKGWVLDPKPSEFLTTQKNPDGSYVKVIMKPQIPNIENKRAENEKWRTLAANASREENDAMDALCEHPWWDRATCRFYEENNPWHFEKKVEDLESSEDTTFYVSKTGRLDTPLSELKEDLANGKKRGGIADDTTFDQYVKLRFREEGSFFQLTLKPKPEGKPRERLYVIRALREALDKAWKAGDK
jgi:hypothetical protein